VALFAKLRIEKEGLKNNEKEDLQLGSRHHGHDDEEKPPFS